MKKYSIYFIFLFSLTILLASSLANAKPSPSTTVDPIPNTLGSWAWSSNIGWLDLRNIKINKPSGLLEGFGWSPNIGWVKFHNLSNYPSNGSATVPARIDLSTGKVFGWIRACAGTIGGETTDYGANCSSMNSRTDGWDGWIELSDDANSASRVKMDTKTGKISGMAWGGPVIGWLQFDAMIVPLALSGTCTGSSDSNGNVTFIANASGGSQKYEYDWNEADEFSGNNRFISPYNASRNTTVALVIRDLVSGDDVRPICPTITRTTGSISGSCSINGDAYDPNRVHEIFVGESLVYSTSGISGGSGGPYTYKLYTGNGLEDFSSSGQKTFFTPVESSSYMRVADTNGSVVAEIQCGRISVLDRNLTLKIGSNGSSANADVFRTRLGSTFGLKWSNTLPKFSSTYIDSSNNPNGYNCVKSVTDEANRDWSSIWQGNINYSGYVSDIKTFDTGTYTFTIRCSGALENKISSVQLKVIDSSATEF